jgi:YidC/Oxa1 family membrane protein insertase
MNPIAYLADHIMIPFLQFSYTTIYPNYGIAIILLTVLIKLILYPLTHRQFQSMKKMQSLVPDLKKLKDTHKDDPKQMQIETMKLYKSHNVNPLGGCLPLLIQMPFLFAIFYTIHGDRFTTLISQPDVFPGLTSFWLTNLSEKDRFYILPVVIGIATFLGQKMTVTDPNQKKLLMFMPIVMVAVSFSMPSGVLLYWAVSQILSSAQQLIAMNGKSTPKKAIIYND